MVGIALAAGTAAPLMATAALGAAGFTAAGVVGGSLAAGCRVPSGVCIYIPGYVYIPFPEIGYVKGMYLIEKVCKTAFTAMFPG